MKLPLPPEFYSGRRSLAGFVLITLIGLGLRLTGIAWGVPDASHSWPYHPDDSLPLVALSKMDLKNLDFNPRHPEGKHAFVYIMAGSLAAGHGLGIIHVVSDEKYYKEKPEELSRIYIWMRLTGIGFDILGVWFMALLATRLFDRRAGWAAAILGMLDPARTVTCHYVTYWAMAPALVTLASLWFLTGKGRWKPGIGAGAVTGLAISVVYLGAVPLLLAALIALRERRFRWFAGIVLTAILFFLMTSPYFLLAPEQTLNGFRRLFGYYGGAATATAGVAEGTLANPPAPLTEVLARVTGWPILLLGITGLMLMWCRGAASARPLALFTGCLVLGSILLRVSLARHVSIMIPFLEIAAAVAVAGLLSSRAGSLVAALAVIYTLFLSLAHLAFFTAVDPRTTGARWIDAHIPAGSRFVAVNWFFIPHIPAEKYPTTTLWADYRDSLSATPHRYLLLGEGRSFLEERDRDPRYRRIATFRSTAPAWAGFLLSESDPPDFRYARPVIALYEKIDGDSAALSVLSRNPRKNQPPIRKK